MAVTFAVLGPGGVGGFVGGALARADLPVTLVARPETAAAIQRAGGLSVRSRLLGRFTARPAVAAELDAPVDCLIVATKANGLAGALARVPAELPALVLPLLKGIEHLELLRSVYGTERVRAAVIRIESDRAAAGAIEQSSPGARIDVAGPENASAPVLAALRAAGLEVRSGAAEPDVMWSKLARLCALALTTSASDRPIGFVRSDPRWRPALERVVAETIAVAVADGASLRAADTLAELDAADAELGSSMRRDLAAGREPELDAIAGAVVRAGARHRLSCPTVESLAERVARRAASAGA